MRDAETGAWRGRGKAGSPASPLLGGDGPRPNLSGAHGQKQTTNGGNVGLEFEDANYFHARNQPSSPSRHKPPTRALPLSFLSLFSVFSIVHPTRRSARGGSGNSTMCSMLPPGDATSPALDCTSTTCVEFFVIFTGAVPLCTKCQHRKPTTWALASSYRPSPRRWLRSKVASAACPPCWNCPKGTRRNLKAYRPYYRAFLLQKGPHSTTRSSKMSRCRSGIPMVVAAFTMPAPLPTLCTLPKTSGMGDICTGDGRYIYRG